MSTKEEKTQENNQHYKQKSETLQFLDNKLPNLIKSEKSTNKDSKEKEVLGAALLKNDDTIDKRENCLKNICDPVVEDGNQTSSSENENSALSKESNLVTNEEVLDLVFENSVLKDPEMSRSNVAKSRLPNKTTSPTALPHNNSKLPGELIGQPSHKNDKEDIKYWKSREQELLAKIAELESKADEKNSRIQDSLNLKEVQMQAKLKNDLMSTIREKENYKNRLQTIENELYNKEKEILTNPNLKNFKSSDEIINYLKTQNEDLRNALSKMTAILRDKTTMCITQEKKIIALMNQVESLKEVVTITKDLLNIRNIEVQHLSSDISAMETKIDCERQRHNQMLIKMDEAVKLNSELKKEYDNQLKLFQHLRKNYEEKIHLLSQDNITKKEAFSAEKKNPNREI